MESSNKMGSCTSCRDKEYDPIINEEYALLPPCHPKSECSNLSTFKEVKLSSQGTKNSKKEAYSVWLAYKMWLVG